MTSDDAGAQGHATVRARQIEGIREVSVNSLGYSRDNIDESIASEVLSLIPAIGDIEDGALRDCVVLTWACAWMDSGYPSLRGVLNGTGSLKLLQHVNSVNDHLGPVIGLAERSYGLDVDHDVALAAAVLHDVDKPLLWTSDGPDKIVFRPGRSVRDHGILGAELAKLCGVPLRVHRIVHGHSPYSDLMAERQSPEAVVVHHADSMAGNLGALTIGLIPACGLTKWVPTPF